ncbi:hypothetical protein Pla108_25420 [Botrimarina colliarenosi]|uniref:DUF2292 domain-containing protein n=1 Tax=Botrimarina colliarenosi TaxID=2528001 RepID=A0A5C6ABS6_9BACT|nr:hypothetical protein [Botrimarina colliarenosi]TWT96768.1 hypothetical protein Pla108_25420 [Botrimarina colliarenosi]
MRTSTPSTDRAVTKSGKAHVAHDALVSLLGEACQRGYYGAVSLTLQVQDGYIQQVKIATERVVK